MKNFIVLLSIVFISINLSAAAAEEDIFANPPSEIPVNLETAPQYVEPPLTWKPPPGNAEIWGAPFVSLFLGFGVGVGMQGNFDKRGWMYATVDTVGWAALIYGSVECNTQAARDRKNGVKVQRCDLDPWVGYAFGLSIISHGIQFIDTVAWSFQHFDEYRGTAYILPKSDGLSLNYMIEF